MRSRVRKNDLEIFRCCWYWRIDRFVVPIISLHHFKKPCGTNVLFVEFPFIGSFVHAEFTVGSGVLFGDTPNRALYKLKRVLHKLERAPYKIIMSAKTYLIECTSVGRHSQESSKHTQKSRMSPNRALYTLKRVLHDYIHPELQKSPIQDPDVRQNLFDMARL